MSHDLPLVKDAHEARTVELKLQKVFFNELGMKLKRQTVCKERVDRKTRLHETLIRSTVSV